MKITLNNGEENSEENIKDSFISSALAARQINALLFHNNEMHQNARLIANLSILQHCKTQYPIFSELLCQCFIPKEQNVFLKNKIKNMILNCESHLKSPMFLGEKTFNLLIMLWKSSRRQPIGKPRGKLQARLRHRQRDSIFKCHTTQNRETKEA